VRSGLLCWCDDSVGDSGISAPAFFDPCEFDRTCIAVFPDDVSFEGDLVLNDLGCALEP